MPAVHPETVRLCAGRHHRPEEGACVVELASMLAGEAFSDRPRSVSPVVAAFMRGYNDGISDARRRDLYPLASEMVGSTAGPEIEVMRLDLCRHWVRPLYRWRWTWRWAARFGLTTWVEDCGRRAARAARDDVTGEAHARALRFARELIHCPASAPPERAPVAPARVPVSL